MIPLTIGLALGFVIGFFCGALADIARRKRVRPSSPYLGFSVGGTYRDDGSIGPVEVSLVDASRDDSPHGRATRLPRRDEKKLRRLRALRRLDVPHEGDRYSKQDTTGTPHDDYHRRKREQYDKEKSDD